TDLYPLSLHDALPIALVVAVAAITLPAADRQHELDPGLVRHLRQRHAIGPVPRPALGHHRHGAARRTIGAEQAELQPVAAAHPRSEEHTSELQSRGHL